MSLFDVSISCYYYVFVKYRSHCIRLDRGDLRSTAVVQAIEIDCKRASLHRPKSQGVERLCALQVTPVSWNMHLAGRSLYTQTEQILSYEVKTFSDIKEDLGPSPEIQCAQ
jgi:hypothetical protein